MSTMERGINLHYYVIVPCALMCIQKRAGIDLDEQVANESEELEARMEGNASYKSIDQVAAQMI